MAPRPSAAIRPTRRLLSHASPDRPLSYPAEFLFTSSIFVRLTYTYIAANHSMQLSTRHLHFVNTARILRSVTTLTTSGDTPLPRTARGARLISTAQDISRCCSRKVGISCTVNGRLFCGIALMCERRLRLIVELFVDQHFHSQNSLSPQRVFPHQDLHYTMA